MTVVLAVHDIVKKSFEKIDKIATEVILPVFSSFQTLFLYYLRARRWLADHEPDRLDIMAPSPKHLDIPAEVLKNEQFLLCVKLEDEIEKLQNCMDDNISIISCDGAQVHEHGDEYVPDRAKLPAYFKHKINENAELIMKNAYVTVITEIDDYRR